MLAQINQLGRLGVRTIWLGTSESFLVEGIDNCEIKVSDAVLITLNSGGPTVYKVSTVKGGWWWHHDVEDAVKRACQELLKAQTPIQMTRRCQNSWKVWAGIANPSLA